MKTMMIIFLLLLAPAIFAKQSDELAPITFQVNTENALLKFRQTLLYPEGLLKRFAPTGAQITDKKVSQNVVSFVATKKVLAISKSVFINGILDTAEDNRICPKKEEGYKLKLLFDNSDDFIIDNVEGLEIVVCLRSQTGSKLTADFKAKIVHGNNYSSIVGPFVISLIKDQVSPLLNALSEEIRSLK